MSAHDTEYPESVYQRISSLLLIILFTQLFSGCAIFNYYFPDKKLKYQEHQAKEKLSFPKGIETNRIQDRMPVPEISPALQHVPLPDEVERPAPLQIGLMKLGIQKRSSGDRQWLYIDKSASNVWPELESFQEKHGLPVAYMSPRTGDIETQWLTKDITYIEKLLLENVIQSNGFAYRLKLQPALQRNTAKLEALILGNATHPVSEEIAKRIETALLDDLSSFLGESFEQKSSVSLLAQQMKRNFQLDIKNEGGEGLHLFINQDFNESWFLLGRAIRDREMPLFDINRSLGLYYLSVGHKDADQFESTPSLKQVIKENKIPDHQEFQIYIREVEAGCIIKVRVNDSVPANDEFSELVLKQIKQSIKSDQS